jgi:hypothetical protein
MRNLQSRIARRNAIDVPANPPKPLDDLVFVTAFGHQLHADTDPEERPALCAHGLVQRFEQAGDGVEPASAIGKRPDPRQNDANGATHGIRIVRYHNGLIVAGFARGAFEGLCR